MLASQGLGASPLVLDAVAGVAGFNAFHKGCHRIWNHLMLTDMYFPGRAGHWLQKVSRTSGNALDSRCCRVHKLLIGSSPGYSAQRALLKIHQQAFPEVRQPSL